MQDGEGPIGTKAMTLRLPEETAAELAAIARTDGMSITAVVREAIDNHITARRANKDFQERLKRLLAEDRLVFGRLAE